MASPQHTPRLPALEPDELAISAAFLRALDPVLGRAAESGTLVIPDMRYRWDGLCVFSDYGGDHTESRYRTYSFVAANFEELSRCAVRMAGVRREYGFQGEMSFKDLKDGQRKRALAQWLEAADFVSGMVLTISIEKAVRSAILENSASSLGEASRVLESVGLGVWNRANAERLLVVSHTVAYLYRFLARPSQGLLWMTDNDAVVDRGSQAIEVVAQKLASYRNCTPRSLGWSRPADYSERDNFRLTDILSIADLAAGTAAELLSRHVDGVLPNYQRRERHEALYAWYSRRGADLRKVHVRVSNRPNNIYVELFHLNVVNEPEP